MRSAEQTLLRPIEELLTRATQRLTSDAEPPDARLALLEAVASSHAGWDLEQFWTLTDQEPGLSDEKTAPLAEEILDSIHATEIPVPLALAALSREVLSADQQRTTGAYYTDWRLAQLLAADSVPRVQQPGLWIDPACGTGILLAAAALAIPEGPDRNTVIQDRLCGADLSSNALRGALLSVSSLTQELTTVKAFKERLLCQDSLRSRAVWQSLAPEGAALIIGNPPWERLRATRHEVAAGYGVRRHYGQSFETEVDLTAPRAQLLAYVAQVVTGTRLQGRGEHDMYKFFLELGLGLAAEDGILAMLVPAGLIRAQGTEPLRRELDALSADLSISVIENRRRHFAIDTRFKFLTVVSRVGEGRRQPLALRVANREGTLPREAVHISRPRLREIREDLSIPEVRTKEEWELFARLSASGVTVGDPGGPWAPSYRRELDMTNDQRDFRRRQQPGDLPVIEGRHVAQFRSRAKAYKSGEGRGAVWLPQQLATATLTPQWFIAPNLLRDATSDRTMSSRIGFCDITGQTNERTLLAARIPAGVVCGNKVPTLRFSEGGQDREDLFLALVNSFIVDWVLRRLVTTTVNFFLLDSLPLPNISAESVPGRRLVVLSRLLSAAEGAEAPDLWQVGQWRAEADALVAQTWGVSSSEMELVLRDFPLVDRGQPALPNEYRSTVTGDCVLTALGILSDEMPRRRAERAENARAIGATAYVPAEFV